MIKTAIKQLKEQADELLALGNSKEHAEGYGLIRATKIIENALTETVKNHPNDIELGAKIREQFNNIN